MGKSQSGGSSKNRSKPGQSQKSIVQQIQNARQRQIKQNNIEKPSEKDNKHKEQDTEHKVTIWQRTFTEPELKTTETDYLEEHRQLR